MANNCTCPASISLGDAWRFVTAIKSGSESKKDLVMDGLCLVSSAVNQFMPTAGATKPEGVTFGTAPPDTHTVEELCDKFEAAIPKGADHNHELVGIAPILIPILLQILSTFFGGTIADLIKKLIAELTA